MNIFVWNLTEMWNSIKNTAHCTNRAGSSVFIGVLSSAVLSQHCTNTALTLHMHCLQGKALQLQHYNKSVPILKKQSHSCPIILRSTFVHPSFILRSSFVHPSIGTRRMIIGSTEDKECSSICT